MDESSLEGALRRAKEGDSEAFAELYEAFRRRVFGLCRHMLGSTEAAEDAASEVFLRVQRAMNTYDTSIPFPRWLLSIASHYCVDKLRRRTVEGRIFALTEADPVERADPSADSPLRQLLVDEKREIVQAAVARLPEKFRVPLVLRFYNEFSYDEIAATLDLRRSYVATLIFRAKKELRRILKGDTQEWVQ